MIISSMGRMMEFLAPSSVHVLRPSKPATTIGLCDKVYEQMRREFFVAGPFVLHSDVPELLAASWSLVRETLFAGEADRGSKEIVAWAVSQANTCPFCIDAHYAAVKACHAQDESLAQWARASASASRAAAASAPFSSHEAEYFGTLVAFHYLNRMVSVFLDEKMMPMPDAMKGVTQSMATYMMGGLIRKGEKINPGDSIELLPRSDSTLAWRPDWAQKAPHIAAALAGWSSTIETLAMERLDSNFLEIAGNAIELWQGETIHSVESSFSSAFESIDEQHVAALTLAMLTVSSPYNVTDSIVTNAITKDCTDTDVLILVAWAAQRSARKCANWMPVIPTQKKYSVNSKTELPAY